jgi:membrane protein implicated in regulation of membrane protease activity
MDPFWNNIYDDVKDRRYGTLFLATLFLGLPLLALAFGAAAGIFAVLKDLFKEYPNISPFEVVYLFLLAGLALMAMALFWRWIRMGRRARQDRLTYSSLSRDELLKARSKLKSQMQPVKFRLVQRPPKLVSRAPETDLKY